VATTKRGGARVLFAVAAVLALLGLGLGGFAMKDSVLGNGRTGDPNRYERETRKLAVFGPTMVTTLKASPKPPPRFVAPPPQPQTPPPPPPAPKVDPKQCDPPYTIDPATGRRKYKMECLK
jgi:hypothetical protein